MFQPPPQDRQPGGEATRPAPEPAAAQGAQAAVPAIGYTAPQVLRVADDLESEGLKPRLITLSRAGLMLRAMAEALAASAAAEGEKR